MIYCRLITHTIQAGDSLYLLARRYQTTVPAILLMNPGINPYNLQIGTKLKICMGDDAMRPQRPQMNEQEMWDDMRKAFMGKGNFGKMYMDGMMFGTANTEAVEQRLMQTPGEIADIFAGYYPREEVQKLQKLLNDQMMLSNAMSRREVYDNPETLRENVQMMNENASMLADALSSMNSFYDKQKMEEMLLEHNAALEQGIRLMANGEYERALMVYEDMQEDMLEMADYLADGLVKKFYQNNDRDND